MNNKNRQVVRFLNNKYRIEMKNIKANIRWFSTTAAVMVLLLTNTLNVNADVSGDLESVHIDQYITGLNSPSSWNRYENAYGYISVRFTSWNEKDNDGHGFPLGYRTKYLEVYIKNASNQDILLFRANRNSPRDAMFNGNNPVTSCNGEVVNYGCAVAGDWATSFVVIRYNKAIYDAIASYSTGITPQYHYYYEVDRTNLSDYDKSGDASVTHNNFRPIQAPTLTGVNFNANSNGGFSMNYTGNGWEGTDGWNFDHNSTILLYRNGSSMNISTTSSSSSSYSFTDGSIFDSQAEYTLRHRFKRNNDYIYSAASSPITIKRLTQPNSITTSLDVCNKSINLSIVMPAFDNNAHDPTMPLTIERWKSNSSSGTYEKDTTFDISFTTSNTTISYTDKTTQNGKWYYYKVKRHPWAMSYRNKESGKIWANFGHPPPPKPNNPDLQDDGSIKVTWNVPAGFCGNSKVKIIVKNLTNGTELPPKAIGDGINEYTMASVQMCVKYTFSLLYETANYGDVEGYNSEPIIVSEPLQIDPILEVSKGYYEDRVSLSWTTTTSPIIENWEVYRKELPSGKYVQVGRFANNQADVINYEDNTALSGVMYMYRVNGVSKCADTNFRTPYITAVGFRQTTGMVLGTITYGSGTAVPDVVVRAEVLEPNPYIGNGKSIVFDSNSCMQVSNTTPFISDTAFTVQFYIRPDSSTSRPRTLFNSDGQFKISLDNLNRIHFNVNGKMLATANRLGHDKYTHITAVFKRNSLQIYTNGQLSDSLSFTPAVQIPNDSATLYIGANDTNFTDGFVGNLDDIRLWKIALKASDISFNYSAVLSGKETDLGLYFRGEEAVDSLDNSNEKIYGEIYDMSYTSHNNVYNRNHAKTWNIKIDRDIVPSVEQLGLKGRTDVNGTYTIASIPYAGTGTSYKITPAYDVHTFKPGQQTLFIGNASLIHNRIDFEDISSFKVWGKILYEGTTVPVQGVYFIVDGEKPCMKDGKLIETDINGNYEIEVPIGWHFISANKVGHTFTTTRGIGEHFPNSRFPTDTATYEGRYDFQTTEEVNFEDNTKVELIGKFVGGPIEGQKPVGFGVSKNNVGRAEIKLKLATKPGMLATNANDYNQPVPNRSSGGKIQSTSYIRNASSDYVSVMTNDTTGEFVVWLLPEDYLINDDKYEIVAANNPNNVIEYKNVIGMKTMKEPIMLYDKDTSSVFIDEQNKKVVDSIECHQKLNLVLRLLPTMEVLDSKKRDTLYGERQYIFTDPVSMVKDTIPLLDNGYYALGRPIFRHQGEYSFAISVFEEYENKDKSPSVINRVPTIDGTVITDNNIAVNVVEFPSEIPLDSLGKATMVLKIDAPNVTVSSQDASNSYLKNFNFRVEFTDGTDPKNWKTTNMEAYVLGAKSDGNNFVTKGPKTVDFVLRDPPGSNSYAWIEEGSTKTTTNQFSFRTGLKIGLTTKFATGVDLKTFAGLGAGVITDAGVKNDFMVGASTTQTGGYDNVTAKTITTTKTISTSSSPDYVGIDGDVFVGAAYNIIFGEARFIDILDAGNAVNNPIPTPLLSNKGNKYYIASDIGLVVVPEFETDFAYTRHHIINNLMPNLEKIRNTYLRYYEGDPPVNNSKLPVYISVIPPDDPNYGKSNRDEKAFGSKGTTFKNKYDSGDKDIIKNPANVNSYYILNPLSWASDSLQTDSVQYYNTEIASWENVLAQDEKQMLSTEKIKNVSFDAGSTYEETETTEESTSHTAVYEGVFNVSAYQNLGATINGTGVFFTIDQDLNTTISDNVTWESGTSLTYGWHLEDGDPSDYHTIDILKGDDIYTTGFKLLGGQTSCPYEDEILATYFEPGKNHVLQQATAKVQEPYLAINPNFMGNVPGNRAANFYLTIGNSSLVAPAWYMLTVDEKTNPDGLILSIDGLPIGNGRLISFNPTESFAKTLSVKRTRMDITEYDDVRLLLSSICEESLNEEVIISVHFLPSCSDLTLDRPVNNQILNIYSGDSAQFVVSEFDVNYNGFSHLVLEYKSATENAYIPFAYYYKDSTAYKADAGTPNEYKSLIGANDYEIRRYWKAPVMDGNYMVRSRSVCTAGPATTYESVSDEVMVIKDMISPVVFGTPQPADGILSIGDDLMLTFNEDIQPDYTYRISVQGELNGEELLHNGGLSFDGINDVMEVKQPVNLEGKSFTVEFWTLRDGSAKEATLFSHGTEENQFEMGLDANDKLWVRINGIRLESAKPVTNIAHSWTHLSAVYNAEKRVIAAHVNGENVIVETAVGAYNITGVLTAGANFGRTNFYNGKVNELRLWTKARTASQIYELMSRRLSGMEMGLSGYWRMNEARGNVVEESIRGRHGTTNASWFVLPAGRALEFDGINQYAHTQILPEIESEADFSVEFWFKANPGKTDACMFSTGRGDEGDYKPTGYPPVTKRFSIYFDNNSILKLRTSGHEETIAENLMDNDWHHFALSVNRHGNANVFVDFNLQRSFPSEYFGMFSGENVWLGAMGWVLSTQGNYTTGSYFKGNIDELRVWRSALTREGIKLAATSRLKGNESGLRAYYPFDTVETATLVHNTLSDQVKESITIEEKVTPNDPFQLFSGADFSTIAANIKPERRLRNVQFDRVYNERQIYLTLTEPMSVIENCILELCVQDVRDMHGNRLLNPVKWTAYIDQNYLKWSEEKLSFTKDVFAPLSFKANVINKSGLEQIFTIENMPAWLTVSPSSGVIAPLGKIEITFTVNEGLNIGSYDENIYLRNSDGFNELLALDLRVVGNQPDWVVDPSKYQYSMNIFGELNIKGIVSIDQEDMLAAFDGNTCVGVAKLRYIPEYDRYLAFLNVYSNATNGTTPLKFKIWQASTGVIYTDVSPNNIVFQENSYLGTAKDPVVFRTSNLIEQHIPLHAGWNWISTNVRKNDMSPQNVLSGNSFDVNDQIKGQQAGIFSTYTDGIFPSFGSNTPISNALMYMLKVKTAKDLVIIGDPVNTDSVLIHVASGWTWIGYPSQINLSLNEAFVGLNPRDGDLVKSQNAFSVYYEGSGGWLGTLNYLTPGNGYLYLSQENTAKTFFYPHVSALSNNHKSLSATVNQKYLSLMDDQLGISRGKYADNLTLIARLDAEDICELDGMILGFIQEECRGYGSTSSIAQVDDNLYFITLSGNQGDQKLNFRYRTADGKTYKIKEILNFGSNQIYGSIKQPVIFTIGEPESDVSPLLSAYPTPFTSTLTLSFRIDDEAAGDVYFSIIDALGKTCATFDQKQLSAGEYSLSLDNYVSSLASGIYFVRMTTATDVQSIKISKAK